MARDYATQRIVYALAALRDGAPEVEVAYAFLERPDAPVTETFGARDVPALAERLTQLAEGVLEGRHPVAAEPHRALCGDCPGRATLCSWPEEMTLRRLASRSPELRDQQPRRVREHERGGARGRSARSPSALVRVSRRGRRADHRSLDRLAQRVQQDRSRARQLAADHDELGVER